jgi:hypothetical protein
MSRDGMSAAVPVAPADATPDSNNDTTPATLTAGAACLRAFRLEPRLVCGIAKSSNKSSQAIGDEQAPSETLVTFCAGFQR